MKFPKPFKKVGKCTAIIFNGEVRLNKRSIVYFGGEAWIAARLSYNMNIAKIPCRTKGGKRAKIGLCCHTCNNFWCINPNHLYIGSKSSNQHDFYATPRGKERKIEFSKLRTGVKRSRETVEKIANWHRGKKRSKLTCARIGDSKRGKPNTEESKKSFKNLEKTLG